MKRIVSVLVMIVMLVSVAMVPVYASSFSDRFPDALYIERYEEKYGDYVARYSEMYYHHVDEVDPNSPIDWAFLLCCQDIAENPEGGGRGYTYVAVVDNVLVYIHYFYSPFETCYAIYDVEKDEFFDISQVDVDEYEGLSEYLYSLAESKKFRHIGDVDGDWSLTVIDATIVQQLVAGYTEYEESDYEVRSFSWVDGKSIKCMSDVDRDGERTIMDATEIQRKVARIE